MKMKMNTAKLVGIDYSLTSPAVCVTNDFVFENTNFYYLTNVKKYQGEMAENIIGYQHKPYDDPIERFTNISDWVLYVLKENHPGNHTCGIGPALHIEGYAYGAKGQGLFQIAENCGILKYRLRKEKWDYNIIVPSVIKKYATGKGNADKEMMYEQFSKDTKTNLKKLLNTEKVGNPISDIVDSWYIAKASYGSI